MSQADAPTDALAALAAEWREGPLFAAFGIEIEELGEGYARLGVDRASQPLRGVRNSLNGGVVATLADAAMQLCTVTVLRPGEQIGPTMELSVSYLSARAASAPSPRRGCCAVAAASPSATSRSVTPRTARSTPRRASPAASGETATQIKASGRTGDHR